MLASLGARQTIAIGTAARGNKQSSRKDRKPIGAPQREIAGLGILAREVRQRLRQTMCGRDHFRRRVLWFSQARITTTTTDVRRPRALQIMMVTTSMPVTAWRCFAI